MLHEYHVVYSVWYYSQFHVTAIGLGTCYPQICGPNVLTFPEEMIYDLNLG